MKIARFQWQGKATWGIVEGEDIYALEGDLYREFRKGAKLCRLGEIKLLAPVEPSITIACGMNYMDHIKELGWEVPKQPALFFKPLHTIVGPEDDVIYPKVSQNLCYEGELCCVIKRRAKDVAEEEALNYVLGYTCGNDFTTPDLSQLDGRLTRSKGFDTSGPLGPFLVTGLDSHNLKIKSRLNGKVQQDSNTGLMNFGVEKLVSYISAFMTLQPGDVVWTGTPGGGLCPVNVGDITEVEIEGIGTLRNKIAAP
ncbi:MAG: fumarylacetoacetate hydrolase family protein [Chloroflexota bacterium]